MYVVSMEVGLEIQFSRPRCRKNVQAEFLSYQNWLTLKWMEINKAASSIWNFRKRRRITQCWFHVDILILVSNGTSKQLSKNNYFTNSRIGMNFLRGSTTTYKALVNYRRDQGKFSHLKPFVTHFVYERIGLVTVRFGKPALILNIPNIRYISIPYVFYE